MCALRHSYRGVIKCYKRTQCYYITQFNSLRSCDIINNNDAAGSLWYFPDGHFKVLLIFTLSDDWWKQDANVCHGETYTNVLTQRNGTCNAIVKDVTCTGTPTPIIMSVGRVGEKKKVLVPMCR